MRFGVPLFLLFSIGAALSPAQPQLKSKPPASRLGMACDQILKMGSAEWMTYSHDHSADAIAAIKAYGVCYEARTNPLASRLARSGRGPSARARADFQDFDKSIQDFSAKALTSTTPPADPLKSALAVLYEKQFRYNFYEGYEAKRSSKQNRASKRVAASQPKKAYGSAQTASAEPAQSANADQSANDMNEMTKAKNHFGELLGALPEDKLHELHEAFGRILGLHSENPTTQLTVYRYAIFLMEPVEISASPKGDTQRPFSAPPF